ncbi:MAG: hypothetical protein K9G76_09355 [Bacteroidales bacterium]|nr:hypothetical protein [Bacteroidales bacterium]MCF8403758.1 hypothetical protein [Bacteroidales bacterium]
MKKIKNNTLNLLVGIILIFSLFGSCKKENESEKIRTTEAILFWAGPYEADGCGYFIEINGIEYKPNNESQIDSSFQVNEEIPVKLEYQYPSRKIEYWCGLLPQAQYSNEIIIISIKKI